MILLKSKERKNGMIRNKFGNRYVSDKSNKTQSNQKILT